MSDKVGTPTPASPAQVPAKKAAKAKSVKVPRTKPTHPPTSDMVLAAIKSLNERNGSSLQAIKKYIVATYKVEAEKQAPFIKKYLVKAVTAGTLTRTKGKGASGSFKVAVKGEKTKSPKKAAAKKPATVKKAASPKKKVTTGEKAAVAAKKPSPKKAAKKPAAKKAAVAKPAAPKPKKSITKKTAKSPAKPKAPKAKKPKAKAAASKVAKKK